MTNLCAHGAPILTCPTCWTKASRFHYFSGAGGAGVTVGYGGGGGGAWSQASLAIGGAGNATNYPPASPAASTQPEPLAAPVSGWRIWRIAQRDEASFDRAAIRELARAADLERALDGRFGWRLAGVGQLVVWDRSVMDAACVGIVGNLSGARWASVGPPGKGDLPPHHDCGCGIWILKHEGNLSDVLAQYCGGGGSYYAYGRVEGWGRGVEHTLGWRMQHARPRQLKVVAPDDQREEIVAALADFYGCEVEAAPERWHPSAQSQAQQAQLLAMATGVRPYTIGAAIAARTPPKRPWQLWLFALLFLISIGNIVARAVFGMAPLPELLIGLLVIVGVSATAMHAPVRRRLARRGNVSA